MYRIMFVKNKKENYGSLYQFDTININGEIKLQEFETTTKLDAYVDDLLENKGYSKNDFIIVTVKDYNIATDIVQ